MRDSAFLIVTASGISRMVKSRPSKGKPHVRPNLKQGEYAVLLHLGVPDEAFQQRPVAQIRLDVTVEKMLEPPVSVAQLDPPPPPPPPIDQDPDYIAGRTEE